MKVFLKLFTLTIVVTLLLIFTAHFIEIGNLFTMPKKVNSQIFLSKHVIDTNVVLVNAGNINRGEMAQLVSNVNKAAPKVMAINLYYNKSKKTPYDSLLISSFKKAKNLILVKRVEDYGIIPNGNYGISDFLVKNENHINSFIIDSNSFEFKAISLYDNSKLHNLKEKQGKEELINFSGNINGIYNGAYVTLDYGHVLSESFDQEIFKDKIVLIGYLGEYIKPQTHDLVDTYYTPLGGESLFPDMYRTVVQANIISTVLSGLYINKLSNVWAYFMIIFFILINSVGGYYILKKSHLGYIFYSIIVFIVEVFLSMIFAIYLFNGFLIMLNIEKLPAALLISFIVFYIIYNILSKKEKFYTNNCEAFK